MGVMEVHRDESHRDLMGEIFFLGNFFMNIESHSQIVTSVG